MLWRSGKFEDNSRMCTCGAKLGGQIRLGRIDQLNSATSFPVQAFCTCEQTKTRIDKIGSYFVLSNGAPPPRLIHRPAFSTECTEDRDIHPSQKIQTVGWSLAPTEVEFLRPDPGSAGGPYICLALALCSLILLNPDFNSRNTPVIPAKISCC